MKINVHEAKTQLSKLIAAAEAGKEVIIARHGKTLAGSSPSRRRGRSAASAR